MWLLAVPARRIAEEMGMVTVANVVMLGFFTAVTGLVSVEAMRKSIVTSVPEATVELNTQAFERGYAYTLENLDSSHTPLTNHRC